MQLESTKKSPGVLLGNFSASCAICFANFFQRELIPAGTGYEARYWSLWPILDRVGKCRSALRHAVGISSRVRRQHARFVSAFRVSSAGPTKGSSSPFARPADIADTR